MVFRWCVILGILTGGRWLHAASVLVVDGPHHFFGKVPESYRRSMKKTIQAAVTSPAGTVRPEKPDSQYFWRGRRHPPEAILRKARGSRAAGILRVQAYFLNNRGRILYAYYRLSDRRFTVYRRLPINGQDSFVQLAEQLRRSISPAAPRGQVSVETKSSADRPSRNADNAEVDLALAFVVAQSVPAEGAMNVIRYRFRDLAQSFHAYIPTPKVAWCLAGVRNRRLRIKDFGCSFRDFNAALFQLSFRGKAESHVDLSQVETRLRGEFPSARKADKRVIVILSPYFFRTTMPRPTSFFHLRLAMQTSPLNYPPPKKQYGVFHRSVYTVSLFQGKTPFRLRLKGGDVYRHASDERGTWERLRGEKVYVNPQYTIARICGRHPWQRKGRLETDVFRPLKRSLVPLLRSGRRYFPPSQRTASLILRQSDGPLWVRCRQETALNQLSQDYRRGKQVVISGHVIFPNTTSRRFRLNPYTIRPARTDCQCPLIRFRSIRRGRVRILPHKRYRFRVRISSFIWRDR